MDEVVRSRAGGVARSGPTAREAVTRPSTTVKARARPSGARKGSQSLERGLDVLEIVDAEGAEIGVREIARRLGLSPTIVQRMVASLSRRGYIEKNIETSRYRLGYRALALGANSEHGSDYIVAARHELERLARVHRLNGFISVLHAGRAVYLLAVQADGPVAIKVTPGSEMPLHSTSAGKVLLASVGDEEARRLLGVARLSAITSHTITDPNALVGSLARVRRQGFATVVEENIRGVLSVGAPIRDRTGRVVAALSVAFPKYLDVGVTLQSVTPLVTGAAQRVSHRVGGKPAAD